MSTDIRKHTSIAAGEKPTRAGLAAAILSISDIVPVANTTEANQIAAALIAAGQNLANTPLTVRRADAPGLHQIEMTKDGTNWTPVSSLLHFTNDTARDSWTTTNSALLSTGDQCISNGFEGWWTGTSWIQDTDFSQAPVTLGPNITHFTTGWGGLIVARRGRVVYINGGILASANITANATAVTLATGYRPAQKVAVLVNVNGSFAEADITTAGVLSITVAIGTGQAVIISGSFPI